MMFHYELIEARKVWDKKRTICVCSIYAHHNKEKGKHTL